MSKLQNCYNQIRNILGNDIEPFTSIELIEKYRQYWKPDNVRIVLLAESHIFTTEDDIKITLPTIKDLPHYPSQYAKFVYCLAYGEKSLTKIKVHPKRDGTPQFWKIFYSCINKVKEMKDFKPIQSKTKPLQRIQNKISTLKQMKDAGIWLIDASIVALYNNGRKPSSKKMKDVISSSWSGYTRDLILEEKPSKVICIGKGVYDVVGNDVIKIVGKNNVKIIYQPNAHLTTAEHLKNFKNYYTTCN